MVILGSALILVGAAIAAIGAIWLVFTAFQESIMWGFGVFLLFPIVGLIFAIMQWNEAKKPVLTHLAGLAVAIIGAAVRICGERAVA